MKPYVKPELYYESFELAQHIAGCSLIPQTTDPKNCTYTGVIGDTDATWFISGSDICSSDGAVGTDDYCYTSSQSNLTIINS